MKTTNGTHSHDSHDHEKCRELFASLSEYIDNDLNDTNCEEIKKHIDACKCCSTCLETLKKTIELCGCIEDRPVPGALSEKLRKLARIS